jgi:hypothetical protein
VHGVSDRWAYFYDLRVKPTHRRRGVAGQIANFLRETIREAGIAGAYSWVIEGNTASESFVERRGSIPVKQCAFALISGSDGAGSRGFERITTRDDEVASLLQATYGLYDLTPPWDPGILYGSLDRLLPLGWQGLYGKRGDGRWTACFGVWDYSSVMQVIFRGRQPETHIRPFFLYPLGWRDPDSLGEALQEARAIIAARDGTLLLPYVPGDVVSVGIPPQAERIGLTLYTRGVPREKMPTDRLVFINPVDL